MKKGLVTILILASVNVFAQKVDMQSSDYTKHIHSASKKTFDNSELVKWEHYQGGFLVDHTRKIDPSKPLCFFYQKDVLKKTDIQNLIFKRSIGDDYLVVYSSRARSSAFMNCYNVTDANDLKDVFGSIVFEKAYAKNIEGAIEILGVTDEQNPEALILNNGVEEIVSCEDILLEDAKNGEVETGLIAFSRDLMEVVSVVAVGHKDAKVKRENGDTVVKPIETLSKVQETIEFSGRDILFIKDNGKKVKVVASGETKIGGVRKILVKKDGKILAVDTGSLIKLK